MEVDIESKTMKILGRVDDHIVFTPKGPVLSKGSPEEAIMYVLFEEHITPVVLGVNASGEFITWMNSPLEKSMERRQENINGNISTETTCNICEDRKIPMHKAAMCPISYIFPPTSEEEPCWNPLEEHFLLCDHCYQEFRKALQIIRDENIEHLAASKL